MIPPECVFWEVPSYGPHCTVRSVIQVPPYSQNKHSNAVWYEALILWTELKMPIAVNKVSTRLAFLMRPRNITFYANFFDSAECVKTYAFLSQVEIFDLA